MADTMQEIRNQLADALDHPDQFSGDAWAAAQQMIGTVAGVSLDGLSPEAAVTEYPWLVRFLRTDDRPDPEQMTSEERAAHEAAIAAREERLGPLHSLNEERSRLAYAVAAERGYDPSDWAALATVYNDPRITVLDQEIAQVRADLQQ